MKILIYLAMFVISSCGATVSNSNSSDRDKYSNEKLEGGKESFRLAQSIIKNKCSECHDFHILSETQMVDQGLLIPGSSSESKLFFRLRDSNTSSSEPANMPIGGRLDPEELVAIAEWIEDLEI